MPPFKQPSFQERAALAADAKKAALERLRAKPPVDAAVVAQRQAAQLAREEAQAKARAERLAAAEEEKAARKARAAEKAAAAQPARPVLSEAEKKAARDARYAARKNRAGK